MTFLPRTETYVNVSSLSDPYNITVTKPSGTVDGDILFCWIGWYAAVTIDSVPSGWNLLGEYIANTDRYALYYKIASGEGASWVWSFTATAKVRAVCSCYTKGDFDASNPINVVSNTAYRTSDAYCKAASMTVAAVNSPLVFWGGFYNTSTGSFTKPSVPTSGWVEDDDVWNTTPDMGTEVCSFIWSGSGATGIMSATNTLTLTTKHAFAVALNPPKPKAFSEVGGGSDAFLNPFRAMGFAESGHGAESVATPFRAMGFSDNCAGSDNYVTPLRIMSFFETVAGTDAFVQEQVIGFISKEFSDSGVGSDSYVILFKTMQFSDVGSGLDSYVTSFRTMNFSDVGSGLDGFNTPFRAMSFSVFGLGSDSYSIPFKAVVFSDAGYGTDVFLIDFKTVLFSDAGYCSDSFTSYVPGEVKIMQMVLTMGPIAINLKTGEIMVAI